MTAKDTTRRLLDVSVDLAAREGYDNLTRDGIAKAAGCSLALPTVRLGQMPELKRNVMRHAIKLRCLPVIAQGLASGDKTARKAPEELKREAALWLAAR